MTSTALNLRAISDAIDQHAERCPNPATAVLLNPYEVERLDFEEIRGVPIKADASLPTGRFRVLCAGEGYEAHGVVEREMVAA